MHTLNLLCYESDEQDQTLGQSDFGFQGGKVPVAL